MSSVGTLARSRGTARLQPSEGEGRRVLSDPIAQRRTRNRTSAQRRYSSYGVRALHQMLDVMIAMSGLPDIYVKTESGATAICHPTRMSTYGELKNLLRGSKEVYIKWDNGLPLVFSLK